MQVKQIFAVYDREGNHQARLFQFCPYCQTELILVESGGEARPECTNCGFVQFRNPFPAVAVIIERDGKILLGRRAGRFETGKWALPGGFIEWEDDFLAAAIREVKEETNLDVEIVSIVDVISNFFTPDMHALAIVLVARVVGGEAVAGDDLNALQWVVPAGPLPEMAFDGDVQVIRMFASPGKRGLAVDPRFSKIGKR